MINTFDEKEENLLEDLSSFLDLGVSYILQFTHPSAGANRAAKWPMQDLGHGCVLY